MPVFEVIGKFTYDFKIRVSAENGEEAKNRAEDIVGEDFNGIGYDGEIETIDIKEVEKD